MTLGPRGDGSGPLGRREVVVVLAALAVVGGVVGFPVVKDGGWILDDWGYIGLATTAAGLGETFADFQGVTHRPGAGVVWTALYLIGGERQAPYLAIGVALAVLTSVLLYAVLRTLGLRRAVAAAPALLLLLFPANDAIRLWFSAMHAPTANCLALAGLLVALRARTLKGHLPALALYAASMLTYETTAGPILLAGLLYGRAGRRRWAADAALVAACIVVLALGGGSDRQAPGRGLDHVLGRIGDFWRPATFEELLPAQQLLFGPPGIALVVLAIAGLTRLPREQLRAWLALGAAGIVSTAAGWLVFLPTGSYYSPVFHGLANRTNATAAIGAVVVLAVLAALVAIGLAALVRAPRAAPVFATVAVLATAIGFARDHRAHQRQVEGAWARASQVVSAVRGTVPELPAGGRVLTFNHRTTMPPPGDYPIFAEFWDLRGALRWIYDERDVDGRPLLLGTLCQDRALVLANGDEWAYDDLHFVDVGAFRSRRITDRETCEATAAEYPLPVQPWQP